MNVSKFITLKEAKKSIVVPNPGERSLMIRSIDSGYENNQVFSSEVFPEKIKGNFLGLVETMKGIAHPAYVLNVTNKELYLRGNKGYENGPAIMNGICNTILNQDGILKVRSVKWSDLKAFNYRQERQPCYWLASLSVYVYSDNNYQYSICYVNRGNAINLGYGDYGYNSCYIRPVVVLDSIVTNIDIDLKCSWIGN